MFFLQNMHILISFKYISQRLLFLLFIVDRYNVVKADKLNELMATFWRSFNIQISENKIPAINIS